MKKLLMLLVAVATIYGVNAQSKFNADYYKKRIESSEADINDPKKSTRVATWITRGDNYYNAAMAPIVGLYRTMPIDELEHNSGQPKEKTQKVVNNREYEVWSYDNYDVYLQGDMVAFWDQKVAVSNDDLLEKAYESYAKAMELDPTTQSSVKPLIEKVVNEYKQKADISFALGDFASASKAFGKAYDYSKNPPIEVVDIIYTYNAGYVSILAEDYDNAVKYLEETRSLGFYNNGDVHKLLYFAYQGKKDNENSEVVLREGIALFPAYTEMIELLMVLYSSTGKDINDIVPIIQEGIEKDPNNFIFHFGLGTLYSKADDYENAIKEFKIASELNPEDFGSFYNLAYSIVRTTDKIIEEMNSVPVSEQQRYEELKTQVNETFKSAIPYLVRANELSPSDANTLQLLRGIYFRFQDESEEMAKKYQETGAAYEAAVAGN